MQDVGGIVERLLGFLETGRDFVTAEAIIQLKDLLRRYPAIAEASLSSVSSISPEVWPCTLLAHATPLVSYVQPSAWSSRSLLLTRSITDYLDR